MTTWQQTTLESLEVGATPLVRHFLQRLQLVPLLERFLPPLPGRQPALDSSVTLGVLVTNLVLARQPLYGLAGWAARRVPEHLGLTAEQVALLNDDRLGRALDHLERADRASLLTALVIHTVREFQLDLSELHQDTTTVTFSGDYARQAPASRTDRPPRITFGYNKDHRPDLKQLLYGITITADGAVPVHAKLFDGNTPDDHVHIPTWDFLHRLIGHADFLYVGDSKLCSRENLQHIASRHGRFLTVMPRTRAEDRWFRDYLGDHSVDWREVHREANPRRRSGPDHVYHGTLGPRLSAEGYRILWYRSSQKAEHDAATRQSRLERAHQAVLALLARRAGVFRNPADAMAAGEQIARQEQVEGLVVVRTMVREWVQSQQIGPGRPGPDTQYRHVTHRRYSIVLEENPEAIRREALCDGVFPLLTNDESLSVAEALGKYKYQPFVEKRHEQLKSVFGVAPMWLKSVKRVSSLLWLYFVVELLGALLEREVRRQMAAAGRTSLALYPEGRDSEAPTTELVLNGLEGHRRHRLLDGSGQEVRRFHDALGEPAVEVLQLLGMSLSPYGLN